MGNNVLTLTNMDTGALPGHQDDERALFEWLARIPCVKSSIGDGRHGLVVKLKRRPGNSDLQSLLALCFRYGIDMRQLARFKRRKTRIGSAIRKNTGIELSSETIPRHHDVAHDRVNPVGYN